MERVISQCLDPQPAARPASVGEILRALPAGDPLAVALAAGETPTPGMVAAAAKTGDLPALVAWGMLLLAVAGVIATAALSRRTLLHRPSGMKAPDVLQERARETLVQAGLIERPADSDLFVHLADLFDVIDVRPNVGSDGGASSPAPRQPQRSRRGLLPPRRLFV